MRIQRQTITRIIIAVVLLMISIKFSLWEKLGIYIGLSANRSSFHQETNQQNQTVYGKLEVNNIYYYSEKGNYRLEAINSKTGNPIVIEIDTPDLIKKDEQSIKKYLVDAGKDLEKIGISVERVRITDKKGKQLGFIYK